MAGRPTILNADFLVKFEIDGHVVELPFEELTQKLGLKINNKKLEDTLIEMIKQYG